MFKQDQAVYNDEIYTLSKAHPLIDCNSNDNLSLLEDTIDKQYSSKSQYYDHEELEFISNIENTKKIIISIEQEIANHLLLDEYKQRSIIETILHEKKQILNTLTNKLSTLHKETEEEKENRVANEKNILETEKKKLYNLETEFNSTIIPPIIDKMEYVSKKKMTEYNNLIAERDRIKLNKNRLGNLINNKHIDLKNAEEKLKLVYNLPNEYDKTILQINNLTKEINEETKKLNSFNTVLRNHSIIQAKLDVYKEKLNENIKNYEKFKLQNISIVSLNKIDEYDNDGNLYKTITNSYDMYNKLNELDKNPPTVQIGGDIYSQREYDFLRDYYDERIYLYNIYNKKNNYLDEFEEDHQKWLNNCKNDLKQIKNRLEELKEVLKNQIFWTDIDHERYNIQKKNIIAEHIKYYNKTVEEIEREIENNYVKVDVYNEYENKDKDITMNQYLKSINY
jgi:hypothetical protein